MSESAYLVRETHRYVAFSTEMDRLLAELQPFVPSIPEDDENLAVVRAACLKREEIDRNLFSTGTGRPTDLVDLLEKLVLLLEDASIEIRRGIGADSHGDHFDGTAAVKDIIQQKIDAALRFFGFDPDSPPNREACHRTYRKQAMAAHRSRDKGGATAEADAHAKILETNLHWQFLMEHLY